MKQVKLFFKQILKYQRPIEVGLHGKQKLKKKKKRHKWKNHNLLGSHGQETDTC